MTGSGDIIDAQFFYGLYEGVFKPHLVRTALLLDVFTPLAEAPLDAAGLGRAAGADAEGIARLADYLVAIGVLERSEGRYSLTPTARAFLVRTSPAFAGDLVLEFTGPGLWQRVLTSVRSGEATSLLERFEQDA